MSKFSLLNQMQINFDECMTLAKKKNSDYSTTDSEGFGNFRALGDGLVELGLIVRLSDKFSRLKSHVSGKPMECETIEGTLKDLINYSNI